MFESEFLKLIVIKGNQIKIKDKDKALILIFMALNN